MAIKTVCDNCGKDADNSLWVWDGGTQVDPPSGRTEETGANLDFCDGCLASTLVRVMRDQRQNQAISRHLTIKTGRTWRGK